MSASSCPTRPWATDPARPPSICASVLSLDPRPMRVDPSAELRSSPQVLACQVTHDTLEGVLRVGQEFPQGFRGVDNAELGPFSRCHGDDGKSCESACGGVPIALPNGTGHQTDRERTVLCRLSTVLGA